MFNINSIVSQSLDFGMTVNYCEYETNSWAYSNEGTSAVVTPGGWLIVNGREAILDSLTFADGKLIVEGNWKDEIEEEDKRNAQVSHFYTIVEDLENAPDDSAFKIAGELIHEHDWDDLIESFCDAYDTNCEAGLYAIKEEIRKRYQVTRIEEDPFYVELDEGTVESKFYEDDDDDDDAWASQFEESEDEDYTFVVKLREFCYYLAHSNNGVQQDYHDIVSFWFEHHLDIKALDFEDQVEWTHFLDYKKYQGDECFNALYEAMNV